MHTLSLNLGRSKPQFSGLMENEKAVSLDFN